MDRPSINFCLFAKWMNHSDDDNNPRCNLLWTGVFWWRQHGWIHCVWNRGVLNESDFWRRETQKVKILFQLAACLSFLLSLCWGMFPQIACRKKKRGKGKGESSDKSDSDDVEVIKEWNTSSRGGNPEGRNRAEPVEEGKFGSIWLHSQFRCPGLFSQPTFNNFQRSRTKATNVTEWWDGYIF